MFLVLGLTGCGAGGGGALALFEQRAVTSIPVLGGAVTVRGPRGYCIDPGASRPDDGFAVMAGCARIAGDDGQPAIPAVLTLQAGAPGSAMVAAEGDALATLLSGPDGASLLAEGRAVAVDEIARAEGAILVSYTEPQQAEGASLAPPLVRAFLDIGDRLVTISVRPVPDMPVTAAEERLLIGEAVATLRAANAAGAAGG